MIIYIWDLLVICYARELVSNLDLNKMSETSDQEVTVWYNDDVICPDAVGLNCTE